MITCLNVILLSFTILLFLKVNYFSESKQFDSCFSVNILASFVAMKSIPAHVRILFLLMGVTLAGLSFTKVLFYAVNQHAFPEVGFLDLVAALWFDVITISLVFYPFILLWLIPVRFRGNKYYQYVFRFLFFITNGLAIGINLMDVIYFQYTSKRSTFDLFSMVGYEQDMNRLWETFIIDFWWVILIYIVLLFLSDKAFRVIFRMFGNFSDKRFRPQIISLIILIPVFIVTGRGGFGLKPVSVINAAQYTRPENTAFVINTAFTMIKSFNENGLEPVRFFKQERAEQLFSPIRKTGDQTEIQLPDSTNVMIIILESFGNEWVGKDENNKSFTPFFDSLCSQGLFFRNSFANGKKSIEAVPAILASVPGFLDNPYISSRYSSNKLTGIGNLFKKQGYSTSFFHGATNGSMNFAGFSALVGYDSYFGRTEYNNEADNDGTWGIYDHKFLPWTARQLSKEKQPFLSTLFTLSSHHPYKVPDKFKSQLPKGPHPICRSINYTDLSLRLFFEEAKKQDWYENTVFVFVADHTPASWSDYYGQRIGMYRIPILFYSPSGKIPAKEQNEIFQQIDIYPSLADLLGFKETIYTYGQSFLSREYPPYAITYLEGTYQLFMDNYLFTYTNEKTKQLFNFQLDLSLEKDLLKETPYKKYENFLKAIIQHFNNDLRLNKTHISE